LKTDYSLQLSELGPATQAGQLKSGANSLLPLAQLSQSLKMATRAERFFCKILYDRSRSRIGPLSRSQSLPVLTALLRPTLTHINKTLSFAHEFLIRLYLYTALPPLTARRRRRLRWINKEFSLGFSHVYALN